MIMDWDAIAAHVLALPDTEMSSSYGRPAIKANGHVIVSPGREAGSFCLHIDRETVEMLMETDPNSFWQTPHYVGWPAVLVRYDTPDPHRVIALIERAHEAAILRKKPRPRRNNRQGTSPGLAKSGEE
jgi:hypothetical protein